MSVLTPIEAATVSAQKNALADRLNAGIALKMRPVHADIHSEILAYAGPDGKIDTASGHAELVAGYCTKQARTISELNEAEQNFRTRADHALDTAEQHAAIIEFAREIGANRRQLKSDQKAFRSYFDADAVIERYHKRVGERERTLAHALERLGVITAQALAEDPSMLHSGFFVELSHNLLADMRSWRGDARIRCAAHQCLASIAGKIDKWPFGAWFEQMLSSTRRVCLDPGEDLWVQCAAFDALMALSPKSIFNTVEVRLAREIPAEKPLLRDNELFLRRKLVRLLCENYSQNTAFSNLLLKLLKDKFGAVRQMFAEVLHLLPAEDAAKFFKNLCRDTDPQVRAALFADVPRLLSVITHKFYAAHISSRIRAENDEFVLRMLLDAASSLAQETITLDSPERDDIFAALSAGVGKFQGREISPKLRRWADEANERIWLASDPDAVEIARVIGAAINGQREAEIRSVKLLKPWLAEDQEKIGRVMSVLAQNDFGLSLKTGRLPKIQRGEWITRRLWRILFEGFNSATDKRQAFLHTTGRSYFGTLLAPSARMAELAPTKVPGEPLFESSEGGWRNYLPLIDQVLAALDHGKTITIFTSAGITELTPPKAALCRLKCFWRICRSFAELAEKRNRNPEEYLEELRTMEIAIAFRGYTGNDSPNPQIARLLCADRAAPMAEQAENTEHVA